MVLLPSSDKRYEGVKELAKAVQEEILERGIDKAEDLGFEVRKDKKGKLKDFMSPRTIRYYLQEEVLSKPDDRLFDNTRGALIFDRRHVLELLAVKRLQKERVPIRAIKVLLKNKSEAELEQFIDDQIIVFTDYEKMNAFVQSSDSKEKPDIRIVEDPRFVTDGTEAEKVNEGELSPSFTVDEFHGIKDPVSTKPKIAEFAPPNPETWIKIGVADGFELHLSEQWYKSKTQEQLREFKNELWTLFTKNF